jgi:sec-independent protein translocase protein TatA
MFGLDNPIHLIFLLILLLLVFGAKRLPEMGRSLGSGMRGFKESLSSDLGKTADLDRPQTAVDETPAGLASVSEQRPPARSR